MGDLNSQASVATLIGDVVASRRAGDRRDLHRALTEALGEAGDGFDAPSALRITVGDEFQGAFADLGSALAVAWRLRFALAEVAQLRFGLGFGPVEVLDPRTGIEDGPGWWAAREAVEAAKALAATPATQQVRTAYRPAPGVGGPDAGAVNAALLCRDHLVGSLSERSQRILAGLVAGRTQAEIAATEEVSASAVSQRVRGDGLMAVLAAQDLLEGVA